MAHYGEILVEHTPEIDAFYVHIDTYFNNPTMVKTKTVNNNSVYMTKIPCQLNNQYRYLIVAVIEDDLPLGALKPLSELKWTEFNARTLSDKFPLKSHDYQPTRNTPLNTKITRINSTKEKSIYECSTFPIRIDILHQKFIDNEYTSTGNIINALETYQTIITLK